MCKTVTPECGTDQESTVIRTKTRNPKVPTIISKVFSSLLLDFHKVIPCRKKKKLMSKFS